PGEMADALREVHRLRPEDCRRAAEERFCVERMARHYLDIYERLAALASRHEEGPYPPHASRAWRAGM
ncbi:hypothetical protein, partial [Archangium sp.]|uniref:hypothetical protein n=1 Tax=Archangium sp. TaxID=1872627 RepID=UPI002D29862C